MTKEASISLKFEVKLAFSLTLYSVVQFNSIISMALENSAHLSLKNGYLTPSSISFTVAYLEETFLMCFHRGIIDICRLRNSREHVFCHNNTININKCVGVSKL